MALTLASCNEDEQVAINQGRGISFRTAMNNSMTRAEDLTTGNLYQKGGFYVYGFNTDGSKLIDNAHFTSTDGTTWNEENGKTYFYPTDNSEVNFFAYAPNLTSEPTCSKDQFSVDFTPETTMANQKDFVFATATGSNSSAQVVQLTLDHKLSKIQVKAKNTNPEYTYKVTGVKVVANKNKGTFTYSGTQGSWTTDGTKESYEVTYTEAKELASDAKYIFEKDEDSFLLVPQQLTAWDPKQDANNNNEGAFISVKISVTANTSGKEIVTNKWAAVPVNTNWQAGNKYTYTLDFSNGAGVVDPENPDGGNPGEPILGNPIKFTVNVGSWIEEDKDVDMDNVN